MQIPAISLFPALHASVMVFKIVVVLHLRAAFKVGKESYKILPYLVHYWSALLIIQKYVICYRYMLQKKIDKRNILTHLYFTEKHIF